MSGIRDARGGVLVVGGGFAGAYVARELGGRGATIVSKENFMLYTPLLPEAFEGMVPYLKEKFGNPQARYDLGQISRQAVEVGRVTYATDVASSGVSWPAPFSPTNLLPRCHT